MSTGTGKVGLGSAIPTPTTVTIGGKEYKLSPLTPFDFATAENMIKEKRLSALLDQTRLVAGVNLPDKVRATAIAELMAQTVSLSEVVDSFNGQLILVFLSLKKNHPELLMKEMQKIPQTDIDVVSSIVREITGIKVEEVEEDAPLEVKETTSTSET